MKKLIACVIALAFVAAVPKVSHVLAAHHVAPATDGGEPFPCWPRCQPPAVR